VETIRITTGGGPVTVWTTATDANPGDTIRYNWSGNDSRLVDTDGNSSNSVLIFDPLNLTPGRYRAEITVADNDNATDTASINFRVVNETPVLSASNDSDGDGIDDLTEGMADSDNDGIPDYLDNISASNVLPEVANTTNSFLVECDPGVQCRLGQFAIMGESGGVLLSQEDLASQEDLGIDPSYEPTGGVFDFEIQDLPTLGQSVRIVLPQVAAIPAEAVYRKFSDGQWHNFVVDDNNAIHSSAGSPGFCPPPGDDSWEAGLNEGYHCIQLTLEDGGPNDADGMVNAAIEDPGAVSVLSADQEQTLSEIHTRGQGGGALAGIGGAGLLLVLGAVAGLGRRRQASNSLDAHSGRTGRHWLLIPGLVLVTSLGALPAPSVQAGEISGSADPFGGSMAVSLSGLLTAARDNGYLFAGAYRAGSTESRADFEQHLADAGIDVDISRYDTDRNSWELGAGYQYHPLLAVEFGYLDLGQVNINFNTTAVPNQLKSTLRRYYPISADGWTLVQKAMLPVPVNDRIHWNFEAGLYHWNSHVDSNYNSLDTGLAGGTELLLGTGVSWRVNERLHLEARVRGIFFDDQRVQMTGIQMRLNY
jgi:large repetitive protein